MKSRILMKIVLSILIAALAVIAVLMANEETHYLYYRADRLGTFGLWLMRTLMGVFAVAFIGNAIFLWRKFL